MGRQRSVLVRDAMRDVVETTLEPAGQEIEISFLKIIISTVAAFEGARGEYDRISTPERPIETGGRDAMEEESDS